MNIDIEKDGVIGFLRDKGVTNEMLGLVDKTIESLTESVHDDTEKAYTILSILIKARLSILIKAREINYLRETFDRQTAQNKVSEFNLFVASYRVGLIINVLNMLVLDVEKELGKGAKNDLIESLKTFIECEFDFKRISNKEGMISFSDKTIKFMNKEGQ